MDRSSDYSVSARFIERVGKHDSRTPLGLILDDMRGRRCRSSRENTVEAVLWWWRRVQPIGDHPRHAGR
jgi:hypothetical protein